jgi:4-amino-4-deoxy-L-arabinose transferase-like glycosyltransferase
MLKKRKSVHIILLFILFSSSIIILFNYWKFRTNGFLAFSDGAKFADVARNLVDGNEYKTSFSFFGSNVFNVPKGILFQAGAIPQLMPRMIAASFSLIGITDFAVILTSSVHFVLLVLATYLLGSKLYGKLVGLLAGLTVAANINFLDYATSGASEPLFAFLGVFGAYLIFLKKKWANIFTLVILVLLYFTRPQAVVFIAGLSFLFLVINFGFFKAFISSLLLIAGVYMIDKFVLYPLSFKYPVYPILIRGKQALFTYSSLNATSDALRGAAIERLSNFQIASKAFYNTYNFYILLPRIMSPYLFGFFVLGLFGFGKDKKILAFKLFTVLVFVGTLIIYVLTIPLFRYIHPVIPLVYIIAVGTMVMLLRRIINYQLSISKQISIIKFQITKRYTVAIVSAVLIFIFTVGQTLGVIFLDSRFEAERLNKGKPPSYVALSRLLKENTNDTDFVVTNLDTWGSWYGERKTVWYPIEPEQLTNSKTGEIPFDAIYLTSYLMDDENYYMGDGWREMFIDPTNHDQEAILDNFEFADEFDLPADDVYENKDHKSILLVRMER